MGFRTADPQLMARGHRRKKTLRLARLCAVNTAYACRMTLPFLAETHVFGIVIHPWKIVGLTGSLVFGLRFLIQWVASEKARKSVIPFGFWECSALGSMLMLSYFAIYQRDSVGVISTAMPLPIYLRNLYFRYTHREPKHAGNAPRPPE